MLKPKAIGFKTLNLEVQPGKITAIIGASGSGKSTLLRLLYGLLSPDEGEVLLRESAFGGPKKKLIPGHDEMKMVTQHTDDLNLFARVIDNIAALLPNTNLTTKKNRSERVLRQLSMIQMADKRVFDLSGGEKQRVAIARALVTRPQVLLLDEPFNQVDASFREGLQQDIRNIVKQTGLTVVMVSHDPAEVLSMADELIVLKDGAIMEAGHPGKFTKAPALIYRPPAEQLQRIKKAEAVLCGINPLKRHVVIYPEWIKITADTNTQSWIVNQVLFKGFYEELLVENGELLIRINNGDLGKYNEGDKVDIGVEKYLEYS